MMRTEARFDLKRRRVDHKKTQFAPAAYKEQDYPFRLSFYDVPPTQEISLEEFETWAIDRLRSTFYSPITGQMVCG
jgi:DNA primase large subunit